MTFKAAADKTSHLKGFWKKGMGALRAQDKSHIAPQSPRRLTGSVDVDTALQRIETNANRWDFGIGYQHTNRKDEFVYWVETHTGSDDQIKVVLKKLAWLKTWLLGDGQELATFERDFVWVPSGATSFTKGSTQVKILAAQGLLYSGTVLHIRDARPDPAPHVARQGRRE